MRKLSIFLFVLTISASFGCNSGNQHTNHSAHNTNSAQTNDNSTFKNIYKAEIKAEPAAIKPNEAVKFTLTVKNEKGEQLKDFEISHEKPMHLILVSEDLAEFYHLHPELQADGSLTVNFTFPAGGRYYFYADYTPKGANQIVDRLPVEIEGEKRAAQELKADANLEKTVENLRVSMSSGAGYESNKDLILTFSVTDASTNKPIGDLENYLGEKAHFVILSNNLQDFVHAHSVKTDNVKSEKAENQEKMSETAKNNAIYVHVNFPNSGLYKIFVEVKRAGKVFMIPFVVDVKQGKTDKMLTETKIPAGYFKIVVSKDGFAPSEVTLSGENTGKLAFLRVDKENCADEIVFKDLNIRKKLPVGEVVLIEIPKDKKGEINFACGMDMMKGKIIIQ